MRRPSEGQVAVVLARDVQLVGIAEALRIVVCRSQDGDGRLAPANQFPTQIYVGRRKARGVLDGALVAQ